MTVAYNPRTGKYTYIKNYIEPKDFTKKFKNKINEVESGDSHLDQDTIINYTVDVIQNNNPIKLSGEDHSNIDHGNLRGSE